MAEQTLGPNLWNNFAKNLTSAIFYVKLPPQCDSSVELINAVAKQIITMHAASDHKVWDIYLSSPTYVYNTILSKTAGDAPFFWPITETQ